jgi:hypothetical protein
MTLLQIVERSWLLLLLCFLTYLLVSSWLEDLRVRKIYRKFQQREHDLICEALRELRKRGAA